MGAIPITRPAGTSGQIQINVSGRFGVGVMPVSIDPVTGVATFPGGAGFGGNITATNLSGTNTGDQTLTGLGGVPTARTISTTAPITGGGDLSASRTLAMAAATGSVDGYLKAVDWTTFNGKGAGTVTAVSVATANGISGSSSGGATPALTLALGAITPSSIACSGNATFNGTLYGFGTTVPQWLVSLGSTISTTKLAIYDNGSGTSFYGFGLTSGALIATTNDIQTCWFSQNAGGSLGVHNPSPGTFLDIGGSGATATPGTEDAMYFTRALVGGVSFPEMAGFAVGRWNDGGGFGPSSRLDIKLKGAESSALTPDVTVMTLQSNGLVIFTGTIGIANAATASVGVGTIAKKMAIYDTSGTLLGYLPIYTSIT